MAGAVGDRPKDSKGLTFRAMGYRKCDEMIWQERWCGPSLGSAATFQGLYCTGEILHV
jgi:hypothetical protein